MTELDPHGDWRPQAELMHKLPLCRWCGKPAGNVAFGAAHWDKFFNSRAPCPGYAPSPTTKEAA